MKTRILIFILAVSFLGSNAQTDSKAQQILKGVSTKYKSMKSLKANFTIKVENEKNNTKEEQKGTLSLKGQKYFLEIAGQDILSDGKTRWTYLKEANEVQIDNQRTDENSITPANIFTIYEKGWNSSFKGEEKSKTITNQLIELIPVDPSSKNITKVKLSINKSQKSISSAKIYDKNGSVQTITIDKFTPDGASEESLYVFNKNKYPGSEIVDLR